MNDTKEATVNSKAANCPCCGEQMERKEGRLCQVCEREGCDPSTNLCHRDLITDGGSGEGPPPDDFDYGDRREDGQFERHPTTDQGEFVQPVRKRYIHTEGCGETTKMGIDLAESFARDPQQYGKTFCANCGDYFPLDEFRWADNGPWMDADPPENYPGGKDGGGA